MSAPRADRPVIREGGTGDKSGAVVALAAALQAKTKRTAKTPRTPRRNKRKNRKSTIVYVLSPAFPPRPWRLGGSTRLFSILADRPLPPPRLSARMDTVTETEAIMILLYGAILLCDMHMDVFPTDRRGAPLVL
jgi:hypothetical protein